VEAAGALLTSDSRYALLEALLVSGVRIAIGFVLSVGVGVPLGVLMWRSRLADRVLGGPALGLQTLPSVCWVPVAVLLIGLDESAVMFVVVMGSCFGAALALRDGLRSLPPIFEQAGRMLGGRGATLFARVLLPASLPALTSSARHAFSFAWRSLMGAELLFMLRAHGLGYLLHQGREVADAAQVVAIMVVMVVTATLTDRFVFVRLERRVHVRFGLAVRD
jgi:NitT/TauT family transport system permease protein